jgi:hypothetical protein
MGIRGKRMRKKEYGLPNDGNVERLDKQRNGKSILTLECKSA